MFLTEPAFVPKTPDAMSQTFMTSFTTKRYNTAAVSHEELAGSNGLNAKDREAMGKSSTSSGRHDKQNGASALDAPRWTLALTALVAVSGLLLR